MLCSGHTQGLTHSIPSGWSDIRGVPGVVSMYGVKGVAVKNCSFEHLGLTGVLADGGSQGVSVTDSTFADTSGSAISIGNVSQAILTPATQVRNKEREERSHLFLLLCLKFLTD